VLYIYTGSSWAKQNAVATFGVKYDDGSVYGIPGTYPVTGSSAFSVTGINTGSTPDEIGVKFQVPFPCRVRGIHWNGGLANAADQFKLYNAADSVLGTITIDSDQVYSTRGQFHLFAADIELTKDVWYRITLLPGGGNSCSVNEFEVASAAYLDQFAGGQNYHRTERTDAGGWTDTTTKVPVISLLINGFDDGTGAASGGGLAIVGPGIVS